MNFISNNQLDSVLLLFKEPTELEHLLLSTSMNKEIKTKKKRYSILVKTLLMITTILLVLVWFSICFKFLCLYAIPVLILAIASIILCITNIKRLDNVKYISSCIDNINYTVLNCNCYRQTNIGNCSDKINVYIEIIDKFKVEQPFIANGQLMINNEDIMIVRIQKIKTRKNIYRAFIKVYQDV